jgi:GntR family transcriptional regulator/MocR family aminotransferase
MRRQWQLICEAVETHLHWQQPGPAGGASLWMIGPDGLDCRRPQAAALQRGVVLERGDVFFARPQPSANHFRLGFGAIPPERIEPVIRRLAHIID